MRNGNTCVWMGIFFPFLFPCCRTCLFFQLAPIMLNVVYKVHSFWKSFSLLHNDKTCVCMAVFFPFFLALFVPCCGFIPTKHLKHVLNMDCNYIWVSNNNHFPESKSNASSWWFSSSYYEMVIVYAKGKIQFNSLRNMLSCIYVILH